MKSRSKPSKPPSSLHYAGSRPPQAQAQGQERFQSQGRGVGVSEATRSRRRRRTVTQHQHQRSRQQQFVPTLDTIPSNKATSDSAAATTPTNRSAKTNIITNRQQKLLSKQPQLSSKPKVTTTKGKGKKTKKRYRRVKRLKPCVPRAVFLIPLMILALERYIGQVIHLDDARTVVYDQVGIDPFAILTNEVDYDFDTKTSIMKTTATTTTATTVSQKKNAFPSLTNITHTPRFKCHSHEQKRILNIHNPYSHSRFIDSRVNNQTIPKIIHQHGPTRCLTRTLDRAAVQWAGSSDRWSYYYWDDDAVERLMRLVISSDRNLLHVPEFPLLKAATMTSKCYDNHNRSITSDDDIGEILSLPSPKLSEQLWQYLTLWLYGGMYVDLSYRPTGFNSTIMIRDSDHGIFVFESNNDPTITDFPSSQDTTTSTIPGSPPKQQEQELPLSSKFMAVTPKHPLIYLTIQHMIRKILLLGSRNGRPRPHKSENSNGEITSLPSASNIAQIALNEAWDDYKNGGRSRIIHSTQQLQTNDGKKQLRQPQQQHRHRRDQQKEQSDDDDDDDIVRTVGTIGRYHDELISSVFQTEMEQKEEYDKLFEQKQKLQQKQREGLDGTEADVSSSSTTTTTKIFGDGDDCHLLGLMHGYRWKR